ncbi:MAG: helix-turn-helix transcriptional regulator [Alistipes sp.]|nr:helix-turn-helix transcriptional regulator [Alistipes sp.]
MREKLAILMEDTGLRVGELAAKLDVKAPVISHILSGRNQPSFALTSKIISTFRQYNPYWWLGSSEIKLVSSSTTPPMANENLSSSQIESPEKNFPNLKNGSSSLADNSEFTESLPILTEKAKSEVERVIVIYSDQSFETFTPRK